MTFDMGSQMEQRMGPVPPRGGTGAEYRAARTHMVYDDDDTGPPEAEPSRLTIAMARLRAWLRHGGAKTA
ncbi:MAG TPA: hypothetical protein VGS21_04055 [Acidimicrobiales bacterium]|nr:hypothetical protein [Acidimicrobiales bacterium]